MATFAEMQAKVSTRLKDPTNTATTTASVADVINDAIAYWSRKRFDFNEFQEVVTLTANDPTVTLVTNTDPQYILNEDGMVIDYAQTRWPLKKVSSAEYDAMNVEGRGIPFAWTQRNNGFEVYWYPDAAYSLTVRGIKSYPRLADQSTATNDFLTEAPDLILYEALSRAYAEFRQDPKMEEYYSNRATNEYQSHKQKTRRNKATGQIAVGGF